jgi:hypothetical protein
MPLSFILGMVACGVYFLSIISAMMVHGIWVATFIERHGRRSGGFFVFGMLTGVGLFQDFLKARQICREQGIKPRWLTWFKSLLIVAGVSAVSVIGYIAFSFIHH